ncbi:MAG: Sigma-70, region 4 [Planctomycetota bacterium]|jgi:DNA-directed RNA polymerase specialized sigma subunit
MSRKDAATKPAASRVNAGKDAEAATDSIPARAALITDILRELTRRERLVLALRYTEELTVAEIAAVMEIAATEVERMLDSIGERVRRRLSPVYARPRLA